jgi:hypothetical protein
LILSQGNYNISIKGDSSLFYPAGEKSSTEKHFTLRKILQKPKRTHKDRIFFIIPEREKDVKGKKRSGMGSGGVGKFPNWANGAKGGG